MKRRCSDSSPFISPQRESLARRACSLSLSLSPSLSLSAIHAIFLVFLYTTIPLTPGEKGESMYVGPGKCILHTAVLISIFHVKAQERERERENKIWWLRFVRSVVGASSCPCDRVCFSDLVVSVSVCRSYSCPSLSLPLSLSCSLSLSLSQVSSWLLPSCVIGVMGEPALIGEMGWSTRPETSTWSPTRKTAPLGPAHAYWPNTGLSA